ncbi:DUF1641 domain-containing protein [Fodinisporobacter ferrooxydans]|uniref:DUF1641 domain-containing protein n=1 Tax=Fodinisporobacter ferrooxydans TaxID=2901836 RepID=A0ABY4CIH9_9BACL|nr:DUF1641 domain-containing protein [Alicyclobacillaceae bacterium MYW30-H2]
MSETSTLEKPAQNVSTLDNTNTAAESNGNFITEDVLLEQLLKPEVQESLTVLIESLPKLTEMVSFLTKAYDLTQMIATDRVLIEDFAGGIREFIKPVEGKVKELAAAAIEANDRAQADQSTIGVFGLLRMLKDPQVQQTFRFAQAFLNVLSEQKK